MGKFYEHRLRMEDHYTYVMVPAYTLGVTTYLENHHIPYEVTKWFLCPDGTDFNINGKPWEFKGVTGPANTVVIKSKCNKDDLREIALETDGMDTALIGDEYDPCDRHVLDNPMTDKEKAEEREHTAWLSGILQVATDQQLSELFPGVKNVRERKERELGVRSYEVYRTVFND